MKVWCVFQADSTVQCEFLMAICATHERAVKALEELKAKDTSIYWDWEITENEVLE